MPFDFSHVTTPFRMQPGLRKLDSCATQLTPNARGAKALREKLAVLSTCWPQALLMSDGFDATPSLNALYAHASAEHPHAFVRTFDGAAAPLLGWTVFADGRIERHAEGLPEVGPCLEALPPAWRSPALLSLAFAEDFAVIEGDSGRVPWLAVCLPSSWAPEHKLGRHFTEIHAPVADNALLLNASDHLARLVTGAQRWERFVWTITRNPRLHAHPDRVDPAPWPADGDSAGDADALAARAFFRTERQTFIPVPGVPQAVFTIHIEVMPLREAVTRPADAQALHEAIATMSDAVLQYRSLADARDRLLDWLQRCAKA